MATKESRLFLKYLLTNQVWSCIVVPVNINISFATDNAAFEDNFLLEVTRVTRSIKDAMLDSENQTTVRKPLKDVNGNHIGVISISHDVPLAQL